MGSFGKWRAGNSDGALAEPTQRRSAAHPGRIRALSLWHAAAELRTMINLIVIVISAIVFGLLLLCWLSPPSRPWFEAPKYSTPPREPPSHTNPKSTPPTL